MLNICVYQYRSIYIYIHVHTSFVRGQGSLSKATSNLLWNSTLAESTGMRYKAGIFAKGSLGKEFSR